MDDTDGDWSEEHIVIVEKLKKKMVVERRHYVSESRQKGFEGSDR